MLLAKVGALKCDAMRYSIDLEDGTSIASKTIVIASGANYRRLPIHDLSRFEGAGVYYGATFVVAQLCRGEEVIVVGGGNPAGQAAVFFAVNVNNLYLLVR